jgi:hypothetical protein
MNLRLNNKLRYVLIAALAIYVASKIPKVIPHLSLLSTEQKSELQMMDTKYKLIKKNDSINGVISSIYTPLNIRVSGNFPNLTINDTFHLQFAVNAYSNMEFRTFESSIETGDSIIKKFNSDTILIIQKSTKKHIKWVIDFKYQEEYEKHKKYL